MIDVCTNVLSYYHYTIAIYDRYLCTYCIITITLLLYMIDICTNVLRYYHYTITIYDRYLYEHIALLP